MRNTVGRRQFLAAAPAVLAARNLNDKIRVGMIGVGTRGIYLMQETQKIPGVEIAAICDLYKGNVERAKAKAVNPQLKVIREWEKVVEDPSIDAVFIATPDFWHAPMTVKAAANKKDVYVEKGLCRTLEECKQIRKAVKDHGIVLQLGHNYNSAPAIHKAREIYQSGVLGKVPLVRMYIDRTNPWPEWKFYTAYDINELPKDASPETIDWERFVANASKRPFDAERFFTWRKWWEYGTGIAGDLMSHLWDSVNAVVGMGIPETVMTQGNHYFWKDGRDVPDMWHVMFDYPSREQAMMFNCTFNSRHVGELAQYLGREKTMETNPGWVKLYDGEWKPEFYEKLQKARAAAAEAGRPDHVVLPPDYSLKPEDLKLTNHFQNFIDCVRTRETPRCGPQRAWEEGVTIVMAVEAYRRERKVRWDPVKEEIV